MIDNVKMFLSSNLIIVQNLVAVSSVWSQVSQSLGTLGPTYRIQIRGVDEPLESCTPRVTVPNLVAQVKHPG